MLATPLSTSQLKADGPVAEDVTPDKQQLLNSLRPNQVEPLWEVMSAMVPPMPGPRASPNVWKYQSLKPLLLQAGKIVTAEEAERRVLMLVNPTLKAPQTTDTLYAGLQLINPGETAPAHRHIAFALRFIIEGDGGFTAVDGQKLSMARGDVILTPRWTWHDHGNEGSEPMVWLDGLDLPVLQSIPVNFAENYQELRYPSVPQTGKTLLKVPWDQVERELSAEGPKPYSEYVYEFSDHPVSTVIGAHAERVAVGASSPPRLESCSFVLHVYSGQGYTRIKRRDGTQVELHWTRSDTLSIPHWYEFENVNTGDSDAYLFAFSDKPMLRNLDLLRRV